MSVAAQGIYQAELGSPIECTFRHPSGAPIAELVQPGSIVETNYGTGPYCVVKVAGPYPYDDGCLHWSLCLVDAKWRERGKRLEANAWVNEIVPVDGRLLKLFEANDDEVVVLGFDEAAARLLQPKPVQLDLFGAAA